MNYFINLLIMYNMELNVRVFRLSSGPKMAENSLERLLYKGESPIKV